MSVSPEYFLCLSHCSGKKTANANYHNKITDWRLKTWNMRNMDPEGGETNKHTEGEGAPCKWGREKEAELCLLEDNDVDPHHEDEDENEDEDQALTVRRERRPRMEQWSITLCGQFSTLLLPFGHKLDVSKMYPQLSFSVLGVHWVEWIKISISNPFVSW